MVAAGGDQEESSFFFAENKDPSSRQRRRGIPLESRTGNTLAVLGEGLRHLSFYDSPPTSSSKATEVEPLGNFIKWTLDAPLPSRYSGSIEMPSREAQLCMIDIYYNELHESLPLVPRSYFYRQLQTRGPFITPLLLNAIYARVARFASAHLDLPSSDVFFHRAKRLLDDFFDVPRVSTVVALIHMSFYEPLPQQNRPQGNQLCRAWMYGGMASRMSIELGLHSERNISKDLPADEIELRRQVFWGCYVTDKMLSGGWERPWILPIMLASVDLPAAAAVSEVDPLESLLIEYSRYMVKFMEIDEGRMMTLGMYYQHEQQQQTSNTGDKERLKEVFAGYQDRFLEWLRLLPPSLQWTPISELSVDNILQLPPPRSCIAHLHLTYNMVHLDLLLRQPHSAIHQFQQRVAATCITQLVHFLCQRPSTVLKFEYLTHCASLALKVHSKYLRNSDISLVRQSWTLFDRSVQSIHIMRQYADIPNSAKFLQQLGSTNTSSGVPLLEPAPKRNNSSSASSVASSTTSNVQQVTVPSQATVSDLVGQQQQQRIGLYNPPSEEGIAAGEIYSFAEHQHQQQSWMLLPANQMLQSMAAAAAAAVVEMHHHHHQQHQQQQQQMPPAVSIHPSTPDTVCNINTTNLPTTPIVPSSTYLWDAHSIQHHQHHQRHQQSIRHQQVSTPPPPALQREQDPKGGASSLVYYHHHHHHQWSFQHE